MRACDKVDTRIQHSHAAEAWRIIEECKCLDIGELYEGVVSFVQIISDVREKNSSC